MNKFIKAALLMGVMMFGFVAVGDVVVDNTVEASSIFGGKNVSDGTTGNAEAGKIVTKIFSFANVFAGIVLAISIVMIILGGLRYILAAGDQRAAEQGKMILIYSAIGILISLSAFALGRFFSSFAVNA